MAQTVAITTFVCPGCGQTLASATPGGGSTVCPSCRWTGDALLFFSTPSDAQAAETALPDDATCIHHPSKKATAICAGTGDYICSLCTIELDGQVYSAEYFNRTGHKSLGKAFERFLPRPDVHALTYLGLCFVPGINYVMVPFAFVWIPHGFILYRRALQLRRTDPLFARVMPRSRVWSLPLCLGLAALGWLGGCIAVIFVILNKRS